MDKVRELLISLHSFMPPCDGCKHNITLNDDVELEITLMTDKGYHPIVLTQSDLLLTPSELLGEILRVLGEIV